MKIVIIVFFIVLLFSNQVQADWQFRYSTMNVTSYKEIDGKLYVGMINGLWSYDLNTGKYNMYNSLNSNLPGNYINSFLELNDGSTLMSTNKGLAIIKNGAITTNALICTSYPDTDARNLYKDSLGNIWTYSSQKVYKWNNNTWFTFNMKQSISHYFELVNLFVNNKQVWVLFNDNTKSSIKYYYSGSWIANYKTAILADTTVIKVFNEDIGFPFRQGEISLANLNNNVIWKNIDGVFIYQDTTWSPTHIFDYDYMNVPNLTCKFRKDQKGNIWYLLIDKTKNSNNIACYNIDSNKVLMYVMGDDKTINDVICLDDGSIMATSRTAMYSKNDSGWVRTPNAVYGLPDTLRYNIYFSSPFRIHNELFTYFTYGSGLFKSGTFYNLSKREFITPNKDPFPFSTITNFAINKYGQGAFLGRMKNEALQYESDSSFVKPMTNKTPPTIKAGADGLVYFDGYQAPLIETNSNLTTWEGNQIRTLNIGNKDTNSNNVIDFDFYGDTIISLGVYYVSWTDPKADSLNSFLSFYRTSTKQLTFYDKYNSCMPDFYQKKTGMYITDMDTVPSVIAIDNKQTVWVLTSENLMQFSVKSSNYYDIPKIPIYYLDHQGLNFDKISNELVACTGYMLYFFNTESLLWDSLDVTKSGISGLNITIKKLVDGRVWATDDLGYLYKYSGKGKFDQFDLKINGNKNLNIPINDFCLTTNGVLYLGTDIGLMYNDKALEVLESSIEAVAGLCISPNPASDYIYVGAYGHLLMSDDISIYNILGEIVKKPHTGTAQVEGVRIDVSGLAPGMYFVRIGDKVNRFVKL